MNATPGTVSLSNGVALDLQRLTVADLRLIHEALGVELRRRHGQAKDFLAAAAGPQTAADKPPPQVADAHSIVVGTVTEIIRQCDSGRTPDPNVWADAMLARLENLRHGKPT